ncbi:hypothetical protein [Clostridium minihomine]|uniref:hypothetical protein n=1 Tax=Clostridium minihomine TaxID=2045012 RepID=UPI000C772C6A|nr:hypothetical protein [Clostridium minihomine]
MIIRQLKAKQYEYLSHQLKCYADSEPFSASCTVNLRINHAEYQLKVQLENRNRVAALQALRIHRGKGSPDYELIVSGVLLSALLEILINQGIQEGQAAG